MPTTQLKTAQLRSIKLEIIRIGFGAWGRGGGGSEFGWGPQDDEESIAALEHRINWIDTAAADGLRPLGAGRRACWKACGSGRAYSPLR
jgi:hypothetical protein